MTGVFLHGVPETARVWDGVRGELGRGDVVALELPGFGCGVPEGFGAGKDAYVDWVIGEIEGVGEPVDLVGHDWGAILAVRVVSLRPDLIRTWVLDYAAVADPAFVWHDFAQIWQGPEGEVFMAGWRMMPDDKRVGTFAGVPETDAVRAMAAAIDERMTDAILALYRSATEVHAEWGPGFVDIPRPGLVLIPSEDPFLDAAMAERAAARAGARTVTLPGQGHWWMLGDPAGSARLLADFWAETP